MFLFRGLLIDTLASDTRHGSRPDFERLDTYGIHKCGEDEISAEKDKQDTVSDESERKRWQEDGNFGQDTYPVGERRNQENKPCRQGWKTFGRAELLFASMAAFRRFTRFDIR